ncbi:hypothetical protein [Pseudovibrio axinellae]|nr:hypothetical protein [Pseudovibrio axinellae]
MNTVVKTLSKVLLLTLPLLFLSVVVRAESTKPTEHPGQVVSLIGEWHAIKIENLRWNDTGWSEDSVELRIKIIEQHGAVFRGTVSYDAPDASPGHDGEKLGTKRTVDILGVFDWDGQHFTIVSKAKDAFTLQGTMLNPHSFEIIGYEAGLHSWVTRDLYIRK